MRSRTLSAILVVIAVLAIALTFFFLFHFESSAFLGAVEKFGFIMKQQILSRFSLTSTDPLSLPAVVAYCLLVTILFKLGLGRDHLDPENKSWVQMLLPRRILYSPSFRKDLRILLFTLPIAALLEAFVCSLDISVQFKMIHGHVWSAVERLGHTVAIFPRSTATDFLSLLFMMVGYDFGAYFAHYLQHRILFLWNFHKVHHSAEVLNVFTIGRLHIVDGILTVVMGSFFLTLGFCVYRFFFGWPASMLPVQVGAALSFLFPVVQVLQHSNLWMTFGPRLQRIFVCPAQHQLHHSNNPEHFGKNLGLLFSMFDWIFGTLHIAEKNPPKDLGFGVAEESGFNWNAVSEWQIFWHPFAENLTAMSHWGASGLGTLKKIIKK